MNVYITKINGLQIQDDLQNMQWRTAEIAGQMGCREMGIFCYDGSSEKDENLISRIDGIIAGLRWGEDVAICQFPTGNGFRFEWELVSRLKVYRCKVVIFIHAPETFVLEADKSKLAQMIKLYNQAEALIVPSLAMRRFLLDNGIRKDMKFIIQEMWDYIIDLNSFNTPQFQREIHSTELGSELPKGGFGLVWYQDENSRHCMEYSVSALLARYLAAGIPVIVPFGISNQTIIEKNRLGLIVNSLEEAKEAVEIMTEAEYQRYVCDIGKFAQTVRNGYYTKKCLIDAIHAICVKDGGEISAPSNIYVPAEQEFTYAVLKESYGGNLALSWSYHGEADGFLIYDTKGNLIWETRNIYQHYFLIKGCQKENGFIVKAYVDTWRGKLAVAESGVSYLREGKCGHADVKVSIIMPAYNAENYITRSIDTALAQSLSDVELIIVDDGSKDNTPNIVDWYEERYANVTVIHQKNGGVAAARNTGIACANGEFIGFMDNDDMIRPDMMARLYGSAQKNDCDIAFTSIYEIKNGVYEAAQQYSVKEDTAISATDFLGMLNAIGWVNFVVIWNKIYRASLVKNRLIPCILCDDSAWTPYILSYASKLCYLNDYGYEYDRSIRPETQVDEWRRESKEDRFMTYKKLTLFYLENGNPEKVSFLKDLAKQDLLSAGRVYAYDAYEKLWQEIDKNLS